MRFFPLKKAHFYVCSLEVSRSLRIAWALREACSGTGSVTAGGGFVKKAAMPLRDTNEDENPLESVTGYTMLEGNAEKPPKAVEL
jgi:hypothetical protein